MNHRAAQTILNKEKHLLQTALGHDDASTTILAVAGPRPDARDTNYARAFAVRIRLS
jgi:hypothetical protein